MGRMGGDTEGNGEEIQGEVGANREETPPEPPQILPHSDAPFVPPPQFGAGPSGKKRSMVSKSCGSEAPSWRREWTTCGGQDGRHGARWLPWGKMATMGVGDRAKMAAKWAKMATMGTRWPSWGWGTGTRWLPWGKMAAMGVGDRDKMATMGTRWQPMDHDGRHGVWRGGQGEDGGHGDKIAAMDGHLEKPRA